MLGQLSTHRSAFGRLPAPFASAGRAAGSQATSASEHAPFKSLLQSSSLRGNPVLGGSYRHAANASPRRAPVRVNAVFERFTERAIKSVMLAQQEAKMFASAQVCLYVSR